MVFWWTLAYLSYLHLYRMYFDWLGWNIDITASQMMITIRLSSMAYDLHDGTQRRVEELSEIQKRDKINRLPSMLEFFSYILFPCSFLAGPAIRIKDYLAYIDGSMFESCPGKKMPPNLIPTLKAFITAFLCILPVILFVPRWNVPMLMSPEHRARPYVYRVLTGWLIISLTRWKCMSSSSLNHLLYPSVETSPLSYRLFCLASW